MVVFVVCQIVRHVTSFVVIAPIVVPVLISPV